MSSRHARAGHGGDRVRYFACNCDGSVNSHARREGLGGGGEGEGGGGEGLGGGGEGEGGGGEGLGGGGEGEGGGGEGDGGGGDGLGGGGEGEGGGGEGLGGGGEGEGGSGGLPPAGCGVCAGRSPAKKKMAVLTPQYRRTLAPFATSHRQHIQQHSASQTHSSGDRASQTHTEHTAQTHRQ